MSKEELLKYLIAEIDLIMHDKDYRFENANGTWYSRESCRDLTNEEVFEELRTELRQLADLEAKLAEKEIEIERLKKEIKEPEEIWNENLAELKKEVKQKLSQEFTEKINAMLKEKVEEKTVELNNQIRLMQESQQIVYDQMQSKINGYLKIIKAKKMMKNKEAIEQLEKVLVLIHNAVNIDSPEYDLVGLYDAVSNQINELKGKVEDE